MPVMEVPDERVSFNLRSPLRSEFCRLRSKPPTLFAEQKCVCNVFSLHSKPSCTFRFAESVAAPNAVRRCSSHKSGLNSVFLKYALKILFFLALQKEKSVRESS